MRRMCSTARTFWAGFSGGKLFIDTIDDAWTNRHHRKSPFLFTTRKQAREQFQDVRRVRVSEVKS